MVWLGKLQLVFSLQFGKSILTKNSHFGPFLVQVAFYPRNDPNVPHIYLLHPSGGMVGGDCLYLSAHLTERSQALLTTIGFSKFYRTNSKYALQKNVFQVDSGACLEWFPQGSIFFPESKAKVSTVFNIAKGARVIACDMLCFGGSGYVGHYNKTEEIDIILYIDISGFVGLRERLRIHQKNGLNDLRGFKISAVLFAIPANKTLLKQVQELIQSVNNDCMIGVTLLDTLLVVRLLGNNNQVMKELLYCIWDIVRLFIVGKNALLPRIWFT